MAHLPAPRARGPAVRQVVQGLRQPIGAASARVSPEVELRRVVVACLAASAVGPRLDLDVVAEQLRRHWSRWHRGGPEQGTWAVDLEELHRALLRAQGVVEDDLWVPFENARMLLAEKGADLVCPPAFVETEGRRRALRDGADEAEMARRWSVEERAASARPRSGRLGDRLVASGLVDRDQVALALRAQERCGGRLGHHLVLRGYLTDEGLAEALGRLHEAPSLGRLPRLAKVVLRALPQGVLRDHPVVPLGAPRDGRIRLALADPKRLGLLAELERGLGLEVEPVVCPEHVIARTRARMSGVPHRARLLAGSPRPGTSSLQPPAQATSTPRVGVGSQREARLARYGRQLLACATESDVQTTVQSLWAEEFARSALFLVEHGDVVGVEAHGIDPDRSRRLRGLRRPIRGHWLVERVVKGGCVYLGPGSGEVGSTWLTDQLGLAPSAQIALLPVQGPAGDVGALLVGHESLLEADEERLDVLRASTRAALRLIQAREALGRLERMGQSTGARTRRST